MGLEDLVFVGSDVGEDVVADLRVITADSGSSVGVLSMRCGGWVIP